MTSCVLVNAPFGGIAVHFGLVAREFAASERVDRVDMVGLRHRPTERLSRLPAIRSNWYAAAAWSTVRQLRELEQQAGERHDVAMFNQVNPALFLAPLVRLPPMVLHLDTTPMITSGMWEHYVGHPPRHPSIEWMKRRIYSKSFRVPDHLIAVSRMVERSLVEHYDVDPASVSVIPFPVDTGFWSRQPDAPPRDDALRITFVGGEFHRKGGDLVLEAARRPEFAECEFHFVTQSDVPDVPANCFVHHDVASNSDELKDLLARSSIFVLPTLADVSSIASLEAMAMGLPVVTTDVGGIPEIVVDGETGFVISPGDSTALVERLRALVDSDDLRARLGAAGYAKVHAEHDLARSVERYLDILERAAAGRG